MRSARASTGCCGRGLPSRISSSKTSSSCVRLRRTRLGCVGCCPISTRLCAEILRENPRIYRREERDQTRAGQGTRNYSRRVAAEIVVLAVCFSVAQRGFHDPGMQEPITPSPPSLSEGLFSLDEYI